MSAGIHHFHSKFDKKKKKRGTIVIKVWTIESGATHNYCVVLRNSHPRFGFLLEFYSMKLVTTELVAARVFPSSHSCQLQPLYKVVDSSLRGLACDRDKQCCHMLVLMFSFLSCCLVNGFNQFGLFCL